MSRLILLHIFGVNMSLKSTETNNERHDFVGERFLCPSFPHPQEYVPIYWGDFKMF